MYWYLWYSRDPLAHFLITVCPSTDTCLADLFIFRVCVNVALEVSKSFLMKSFFNPTSKSTNRCRQHTVVINCRRPERGSETRRERDTPNEWLCMEHRKEVHVVLLGIEHRLKREETGFTVATAHAHKNDDETEKCTSRGVIITVDKHIASAIARMAEKPMEEKNIKSRIDNAWVNCHGRLHVFTGGTLKDGPTDMKPSWEH